ncbi:hypothetical protein MNBD_GAMMA26-1396 [hydrothermal vent metagenome]|uniref:Transcriptional regulator, Crp/Fnr family n=1 Tax=hydrothermal vent metagenome TaxID=652676 RepID=A0A3B1B6Y3_9ZZZZ
MCHFKSIPTASGVAPCSEVACANCDFFDVLEVIEGNADCQFINPMLKKRQKISKGESLFRIGQPFYAAYAVKSGTFMSYRLLDNGEEQVLRFYLPGEVFGMDAIASDQYEYVTKALEPGSVCELHFGQMGKGSDSYVDLQSSLIRVMGSQIGQVQQQSLLASRPSADERVAAFLLDLSSRLNRRQIEHLDFRMAMSRQQIASYLGIAIETVSRVLKRFQQQGLLEVSGKRVSLLDVDGLQAIAHIPLKV